MQHARRPPGRNDDHSGMRIGQSSAIRSCSLIVTLLPSEVFRDIRDAQISLCFPLSLGGAFGRAEGRRNEMAPLIAHSGDAGSGVQAMSVCVCPSSAWFEAIPRLIVPW